MKNLKRNAVVVTVLLFVCAAVYLNWSYNKKWGEPNSEMVMAEDAAMSQATQVYNTSAKADPMQEPSAQDASAPLDSSAQDTSAPLDSSAQDASAPMDMSSEEHSNLSSDYFATARLTRQQSRDEALSLLQQAAASNAASQETIDTAISEISVMANYSMEEAQIENMLIAKDFEDCVVFRSSEGVTVAVPAPADGLDETSVAKITDIITNEAGIPATQLRIIEVK